VNAEFLAHITTRVSVLTHNEENRGGPQFLPWPPPAGNVASAGLLF